MASSKQLRRIPIGVRLAIGPLIAVIVIVLLAGDLVSPFLGSVLALAAVYTVVVLSVSLLAGWSGVWSIGQPGMVAVGAYTAAFGSTQGWPLEVVVLVSILIAGAFGAFLGFAGSRFSTLYIALLTLAFNLMILEIIIHWTPVTGGDVGIAVGELTSVTGLFSLVGGAPGAELFVVGAAGVIASLAVLARKTSARRRISAAKSHPIAARTVGIAPEGQIAFAFAVSAALAAFGGVLYALVGGYVSEETASTGFGVEIIAATVLGGVGTISGAALGGLFIAFSPNLASILHISQPILQGVILILALILLRKGLAVPIGALLRRLFRIAHQDTSRPGIVTETFALPKRAPEATGSLLKVDDLSITFGGLKALRDIGLEIGRDEVVCIIGPNGAGKTTFMNAVSGLLPKKTVSGTIRYESTHLGPGGAVRRHRLGIARTFQHAELFSDLTVVQNVLASRRRTGRGELVRAMSLLEQLGLRDHADDFPDQLAFGARKRIDLARALFTAPQLLLMDEPFGGLDDAERQVMRAAIEWVRGQGVTVVVIDHVLDDLRSLADRFVAFDFGTVLASGTPDEVLADPRVIEAYLGGESSQSARSVREEPIGDELITMTDVGYRYGTVRAVEGLTMTVRRGEITGIVGANGAGKSTTGKLLHGDIRGHGDRTVREGRTRISLVPEGRALFAQLSVKENLEVAGYAAGLSGREIKAELHRWTAWLPERVRTRMGSPAGALSGGEQQMVAIARALMAKPEVLILDEPALGLAPNLIDEVYARILELSASGVTVVLLEQLLSRAASVCDQVIVLRDGGIAHVGRPGDDDFDAQLEAAYFGSPASSPSGGM
jgi:ABC-type branched-subunit amino acid transport system ATPase component/ABC-type branched-subunit amino acid transport system permease subunit